MRLHSLLDASAAEIELCSFRIIRGICIVPFHPLPAGHPARPAERAKCWGSAVSDQELIREPRVFFALPAPARRFDVEDELMPLEPLAHGLGLIGIDEANPAVGGIIKEKAAILEPFLQERVGPGQQTNQLARHHVQVWFNS